MSSLEKVRISSGSSVPASQYLPAHGPRQSRIAEIMKPTLGPQNWRDNVVDSWRNVFTTLRVPMDGVVIEVAPGEGTNVPMALASMGFKGTLFVIDPAEDVMYATTEPAYKKLLPEARIISVCQSLEDARTRSELIQHYAKKGLVDCLVANHVLDDMLIGQHLSRTMTPSQASLFFSNHYENNLQTAAKTSLAWQGLLGRQDGTTPEGVRSSIASEWVHFACDVGPRTVALADYPSAYFLMYGDALPALKHAEIQAQLAQKQITKSLTQSGIFSTTEVPTDLALHGGTGCWLLAERKITK